MEQILFRDAYSSHQLAKYGTSTSPFNSYKPFNTINRLYNDLPTGSFKTRVFIEIPSSYEILGETNKVTFCIELLANWYGLKDTGLNWYECIKTGLEDYGFIQS